MLLIKNPAGSERGDPHARQRRARPRLAVVALNDEIADGRDVSWIWDVDFEPLQRQASSGSSRPAAAPPSRAQVRVRRPSLRDRIEVVPDLERGARPRPRADPGPAGGSSLLPTYTAMLALRQDRRPSRGHTRNLLGGHRSDPDARRRTCTRTT